jgi:excisionase family DNA binding protein
MSDREERKGTLVDVVDPAEDRVDPGEAAHSARRLRRMLEHEDGVEPADLLVRGSNGHTERLPLGIAHMIASMLEELAQGHTVAVVSEAEEVTTSTAAELLGVSRPHLVKLVDSGVLPGRMAGTHRRVRLTDLLAYKRRTARTNAILDDLAAETAALGLYEAPDQQGA